MALRFPDGGGLTDDALERHFKAKDCDPDVSVLPDQAVRPLRRLLWAKLLRVVTGSNLEDWAKQLETQRTQYRELKDTHRREQDVKKFDPSVCNPLSKSQDNPLLKIQANKDLQEEIWKDIERTYSEMEIFQSDKVRKCMQQVLFHWCKACNPAVDASESYRQGMNELVALCMYVVLQGQYAGTNSDGLCGRLCGDAYNEGDTYALFSALMEAGGLRDMFEVVKAKPAAKKGPTFDMGDSLLGRNARPAFQQPRSAILARCDHIYNTVLKKLDVELHAFLVKQGIEPQIFMLRWLRLLFCREYHIDDVLVLWTAIFADSQSSLPESPLMKYNRKPGKGSEGIAVAEASSMALPLVDFFAVAMVMYLKSQLLDMDESGCLRRLMKFPPVEKVSTLINLAQQLRSGSPASAPIPVLRSSSPTSKPAQPHEAVVPGASSSAVSRSIEADALAPEREDPLSKPVEDANTIAAAGLLRAATDPLSAKTVPDSGLASQVAELRRKVSQLEQEKIAIATKGRQFIANKTAEFQAKIAEMESRMVDSGSGVDQQALQQAVSEASELREKLQATQEVAYQTEQAMADKVANLENALMASQSETTRLLNEVSELVAASKTAGTTEAELQAAEEKMAALTAAKEAAENAIEDKVAAAVVAAKDAAEAAAADKIAVAVAAQGDAEAKATELSEEVAQLKAKISALEEAQTKTVPASSEAQNVAQEEAF